MPRFTRNPSFTTALKRSPEFIAGLEDEAEEVAKHAKDIAPVGAVTHKLKSGFTVRPGDYRDSIEAVTNERGEVYVTAKDFKAWWIEHGSIHNTPRAPLRRGVQATGLKFRAGK